MVADPTYISAAHAARLLGVSRQRVSELVEEGKLTGRRERHRLYVPRGEVVARRASSAAQESAMSVQRVAQHFRVADDTVRRWYRVGLLHGVRGPDGSLSFSHEAVMAFKPPKRGRPRGAAR